MHEIYIFFVDHVKPMFLLLTTGIISMFTPISDAMYVLGISFMFNIIMGIIADVHVNKMDFSIKKAFDAIVQVTFFVALIFFINSVATSLLDFDIGAKGVKWATYIVVYFYLTNILRNASLISPKNKAVLFMYMILTTEVFNRLKEFIGIRSISGAHEIIVDKEPAPTNQEPDIK